MTKPKNNEAINVIIIKSTAGKEYLITSNS